MSYTDIIVYCVVLTITVLINARVYWLVKYKNEDPLKAIKPFWERNSEDEEEYKKVMDHG